MQVSADQYLVNERRIHTDARVSSASGITNIIQVTVHTIEESDVHETW